jgi:hypothetical protein
LVLVDLEREKDRVCFGTPAKLALATICDGIPSNTCRPDLRHCAAAVDSVPEAESRLLAEMDKVLAVWLKFAAVHRWLPPCTAFYHAALPATGLDAARSIAHLRPARRPCPRRAGSPLFKEFSRMQLSQQPTTWPSCRQSSRELSVSTGRFFLDFPGREQKQAIWQRHLLRV